MAHTSAESRNRPLTREEFQRFFDATAKRRACLRCDGVLQWWSEGDRKSRIALLSFPFPDFDLAAAADVLDVATLVCADCGDVSMIARSVIFDWLADHPKG